MYFVSRLQMEGWDGTWYPERNSQVNGKLKSVDTDGACVHNDHITEMSQRMLIFKATFKRV